MSEPAPAEPAGRGPITLLARHVLIPAAILAMVASLLFFLLEVRAVFLPGGRALKLVGFCFSAATVLIARYGRIFGDEANEGPGPGCYTAALAVATLLFMTVRSSAASFLPNLLILAAVWRFATGVTLALSLESELDPADLRDQSLELYGLERVRFEEFRRRQREERGAAWGSLWQVVRRPPDAHGNPVAAVARLAALALLAFALGEPWLLRAEPTIGERALVDVVVFLFSTSLVLAAGSAAGTLRHTLRAKGRVAAGVLPARIALAALVSLAVLAAALATPGVKYQGHGRLRVAGRSGPLGGDEGQSSGQHTGDGGQLGQAPSKPGFLTPQDAAPGPSMVNLLSGLGRLLRIPFLLTVLFLALLAVRRLGSRVPGWRELLARLGAWLRGRLPERKPRPAPGRDPFADLGTLAALPPRDAVLAAYGRLLAALDQAGHRRPERSTPYEHLDALPRSLRPIAAPARTLTDLYVAVAYGDRPATEGDRDGVIAALEEVRGTSVAAP